MTHRRLISAIIAVSWATSVFAVRASADYVQLNAELVHDGVMSGGAPRDVYRIYVQFNDPTDYVTSVSDNAANPMVIRLMHTVITLQGPTE